MINELYIWHHLGIGDAFICNGIVRHYSKIYSKIYLFYRDPYLEKVKRLYKDLSNIEFIDGGVKEDNLAKIWELLNPTKKLLKLVINRLPDTLTFDQEFYRLARLPFNYKWDKFYFNRDLKREKEVYYDVLGLKDNEEYTFLHTANRDGSDITPKEVQKDIKIIRPNNQEVDLYDFLYTMEKAKEVHMMNSSFQCLVDCIQLKNDNLFYHKHIRPDSDQVLKLNWKIL